MKYQKVTLLALAIMLLSAPIFAQPEPIDQDVPIRLKDQQILDDLIVDGSLCVGFDCVNGESFGFKTLRLKENNLRIHFDDTSTSASFPSSDWCIQINDTSNGGANYYGVVHENTGRRIFTLEANAPSHSLYVDDGGRLGLGTSTPVADVHVKTGNTPTLRLEQDGSSGFTAQTWDVAGNEANFFIRDATSGSTLPFRLFPGAPSNALTIEGSTGDIGIGTTSPTANLHVVGPNSGSATVTALFSKSGSGNNIMNLDNSTDNGPAQIRLSTSSTNRRIVAESSPGVFDTQIELRGSAVRFYNSTGNCDIDPGVPSTTCTSSRTLKTNIVSFEAEDILDRIAAVPVTTYQWKSELAEHGSAAELRMGMIAQDFHTVFGRGSDERIIFNDVRMALWLGVQKLNQENKEIEQVLEKRNHRISELEQKVNDLSTQLEKITQLIESNNQNATLTGVEKARLGQNHPNPYLNQTVIEYFIPQNAQNAEIHVYDNKGQLLMTQSLETSGIGQLSLKADDIPVGTYNYSLIIDGNVIDTKQMILMR